MKISVSWMVLVFFAVGTGRLSAQEPFVPEGIESVGLQRIVEDTIAFFNDWDGDGQRDPQLGNWEPYTSVLGNSAFLIQSGTYAESLDPTFPVMMQRFGVVFQAVGGGAPSRGEAFFADDGTPYRGPINNYRQNGNPGRVAGDKRPGAVHFIAGGETSADEFAPFRSDDRWDTGVIRGGRYGTVQTHSLDLATLAQTSTGKAFDAVLGRLKSGDATRGGDTQIGRFGGDMTALSDGNFVVVVDDLSNLIGTSRSATAVIVAPDGSIVRDSFVIGAGELWSNVCAFKGGFCVRLSGRLKFYNNSGDLQGEADQNDATIVDDFGSTLFAFDRGRGDGARIASHINSNYVFLAGRNNEPVKDVRVAVWDARDQSFKGSVNVNELSEANGGTDPADFRPLFDRVNLAVDALNRAVVTYEVQPQGYIAQQVAARVLAFDEATGKFSYLTKSFFPFINHAQELSFGLPIKSYRPSASMTTKEILIAANGQPNTMNTPDQGADVPGDTNFYTVISHPDPKDDPTEPIP
jgi:hypothetical protein